MPLLEPYRSPKVHHLAMRPDPAALPVAGCVTNAQPVPASMANRLPLADSTRRHSNVEYGTAASVSNLGRQKASASPETCAALMSMKAFHRQKHLPDVGAHFTSFAGKGPQTESHSTFSDSFKPLKVTRRKCRYDFDGPGVPRGTLSGVGVSVPALDLTNSWESTTRTTMTASQQAPPPRRQLVERTRVAVAQSREAPEAWKSSTMAVFSPPDQQLLATLRESIATRQEMLQKRTEFKPLRALA